MLIGLVSQTFSRLSGALKLSEKDRAKLIRFLTRQVTISLGPPQGSTEDPWARVGLRIRLRQRAITRGRRDAERRKYLRTSFAVK